MIPFPNHCPPSTAKTWPVTYRGPRPGQECDGVGDLVGRSEPAHRDVALDSMNEIFREPELAVRPLRADGARSYSIDPNPVRRPLDGERSSQREDAGLGGGGVGRPRSRHPRVGGHDVDNGRRRRLAQERERGLRTVERTVQDDSHHSPPAVRGNSLRGSDEVTGRVVHEHVEPAELSSSGRHQRLDLLEVPDIGRNGNDASAGLSQHLRPPDEMLGRTTGNHQVESRLSEVLGDHPTQPGSPTRDQSDRPSRWGSGH